MRDSRSRIFGAQAFQAILFLGVLCGVLLLAAEGSALISAGPRQKGEEVLRELLMGQNRVIVSVESNGCTDKASFKVDVKKEGGLSSSAPHYFLTIRRIKPDEGKAIVPEGALVAFDLAQDLGIKGDFTYSITNRVLSLSKVPPSDESLMSVIEKYLSIGSYERKQNEQEKDQAAEAAKLLIRRGADVNAKNVEGNTPLYVAVHQKQEELVRPIHIAVADGNQEIIDILKKGRIIL